MAVLLDMALMPWIFGASWLFKFVLAVLPFAFLFLRGDALIIIFAITLVYLRAASGFNLGILLAALGTFLFFDRWFLIKFFHKTAWQTMVLSGAGVFVFYAVLLTLTRFLTPAAFYLNTGLIISAILTAGASAGFNMLFSRMYPVE